MSERQAAQAVLEPASSPRRVSERLAANPWVRRLAVLGYVAKGLLYIVTGGTAVLALMQVGGRVRGTRGALDLLVASPFGRLAAALVAVGLVGYILRRFVQVFVQPAEGKPPRPITRVMRRIGFALSGLAHVGITLAALQLTLGLTVPNLDEGRPARGWASLVLGWTPLHGWVIFLAGLVVVGVAVFYISVAVRRRFTIDLQLERMDDKIKRAALACGIAGFLGRGVAFLILGAFLVYAGWYIADAESRRFGDVLRALESQPSGVWLLIAIAVGLTAYGVYLLLAARYVRLIASW